MSGSIDSAIRKVWISKLREIARFTELATFPEQIFIDEWAEKKLGISFQNHPWQKKILRDLNNRDIVRHVLVMAAQEAGKTEIGNVGIGYCVDQNPCGIQVMLPDLDAAEAWMKEKFTPMVRAHDCFRGKIADGTKREAGNTIRHKIFPGGFVSVSGSNAPAGLARRSARFLWSDEPDRYPESAGVEGDPVTLLWNRGGSYHDVIQLITGTPTIKNQSRIMREFEDSDQQYLFVPCPYCKEFQILKWEFMEFGSRKRGTVEDPGYICSKCEEMWDDKQRCGAIRTGELKATAPFKGIRGYHLSGLYSLRRPQRGYKTRMQEMVVKFLEAKKRGKTSLKVWINTFLAEPYEDEGDSVDPIPVMKRCEQYKDEIPEDVLLLVASVDVQPNRLEIEIVGAGNNEETWGIEFEIIEGDPLAMMTWNKAKEFLFKKRKHPILGDMTPLVVTVDSGHATKAVYPFCKSCWPKRVYPVKGSSTEAAPAAVLSKRKALVMVGTDTLKETIYSRLRLEQPGPGYMHYPIGRGYDEEYFIQLTSETVSTKWEKGKLKRKWEKKRERNEALDIRVYAFAALHIINANWNKLAANLEKKKETPKEEEKPKEETRTTTTTQPSRRREISRPYGWGGWLR